MKVALVRLLSDTLSDLGIKDIVPDVSWSENAVHGEYTTNIALRVAKQQKNAPMDIALQVVSSIQHQKSKIKSDGGDQNSVPSDQTTAGKSKTNNILQDIDHVEAVNPGFINFFLSEAKLSSELSQLLKHENNAPLGHISPSKKKIMVEFTDPNPFKELHIGHLYSNAVGESIARLKEATGSAVKRADYYGDVGMHVSKSLWGLKKKLAKDKKQVSDIEKLPLADRIHYLGQAYAIGSQAYEGDTKDEKAIEEMKDINYCVYIVAQQRNEKERRVKSTVDYSSYIDLKKQKLLEEVTKLYTIGYAWSMEYFRSVFQRLGTTFDYFYPESVVAEKGMELVASHVGSVFEKSDGAVVYRGEKDGLHTRVFVNALGLPTYEAKELGLAPAKYADFAYDTSYIVTGNEINEYFHVLMAALSKISPDIASKNFHIGHGMVRLPEGKMSSRTGNIKTAEWLLEEVKKEIYTILEQSKSQYNKEEQEMIAEAATIAAVKYSLLRVSLPSNIAFDLGKSVTFDGDSGPYLLYTYARCRSVLVKASKSDTPVVLSGLNPEERSVVRLLVHYPEVVSDAADHISPSMLCGFVNDLAQAFNLLYAKHEILGSPARLVLTQATAFVLKHALTLLGIPTVERM